VVNAYDFSIRYVLGNGAVYVPENNNIYIGDVSELGLSVEFVSSIAVDIIDTSSFVYTDWFGNQTTLPLVKGNYKYRFPLDLSATVIRSASLDITDTAV
jgi:hypothetical protein